MTRPPHVIESRRWALELSPAQLQRIALQRSRAFVSSLGRPLTPEVSAAWEAILLGAETRLDGERIAAWYQSLPQDLNVVKDLIFLFGVAQRMPEAVGRPVLCDRPPNAVPIDHVHVFDLCTEEIRRAVTQAVNGVEAEVTQSAMELFVQRQARDDHKLAKVRAILDSVVGFALRFTEGRGINNEMVRFWIARNAHYARRAVDPGERRASFQSLEKIVEALMPSEWVKQGPYETGLALEYLQLKNSMAPIAKKKYQNPAARVLVLQEKLPTLPTDTVARFAGRPPREFALNVLAALSGGLSPNYLRNLINRGNLFLKICACWSQALAEVPLSGLPPSRLTKH